MKRNPIIRKIDRLAARYLLFLYAGLIKILSEKAAYRLSEKVADFAFVILKKYRKITIDNLSRVFKGKKSPDEIRKIAGDVFRQISLSMTEIILISIEKNRFKKLKDNISVEGLEHLNEVLSKGRGAICVSAHFGNFTLMTRRLDMEGYSFNMVMRDADDPVVNNFFKDMMTKIGIRVISARPRRRAVTESLRWLRKNKPLCLHADQNKTEGIYVDFLGLPAGTVEGPARLHLRTGAPIMCAFIIRLDKRRHKIVITPPIDIKLTGDNEKDIYEITKSFTKVIGDFVIGYPEQWWWVHNRWKGSKLVTKKQNIRFS